MRALAAWQLTTSSSAPGTDAEPVLVRMTRDGKTVIVASMIELSAGGWFVDSMSWCEGFDVGAR